MPKAEPEIGFVVKCKLHTTDPFPTVDAARTLRDLLETSNATCGPHRVFKRTMEEVTDAE